MAARHMLSAVAAAALLVCHPAASALTLGKLTVQSALGEALVADIEVTSLSTDEATSLTSSVAPVEMYRSSGVEFNSALLDARAKLLRRPDGTAFIRVTGDRAVMDPFLDLILDFSWGGGKLQRAYTLLVDPRSTTSPVSAVVTAPAMSVTPPASGVGALPQLVTPAPVTVASGAPPAPLAGASAPETPAVNPTAAASQRGRLRVRQPKAVGASVPPAAEAASAAASDAVGSTVSGEQYQVKRGDTLVRIAQTHLPEGVSLDQMLVSLYQGNRDAFMGRNMNRLKSGSVLALPDAQAAGKVATSDARRLIRAHSADFAAFRQTLASTVPQAPAESPASQASGKVEAAVQDRKQGTAGSGGDQLQLSGSAKPGVAEVQVSKQTQRKDTEARVAELSRNIEELKKLPAAGATPPATKAPASQVAASQAPAILPALPVAPVAPAPSAVVAPVAPAASMAASVTAPASAGASAVVAASSVASAAATVASGASSSASQPARRVVAPVPESDEGSIFDMLPDLAIPVGAGLVAVLVGLGAMRFWRRRKESTTETSFIESKLQADSFFGASGGQRVDTRESSTPTSSSLSYSLSQLDAIGDVDPVAEADVYLAYGRDLQAEEILKEALRTDPNRLAIRVKLLEVYAKREDVRSFDTQVQQVRELTGGVGDEWEHVLELGRQLDPSNPQYQMTGSGVSVDLDTSIGGDLSELGDDPMPTLPAMHEPDAQESSNELDLDIDLANPVRLTGLEKTRPVPTMQPPSDSTLGMPNAPIVGDSHLGTDFGPLPALDPRLAAVPATASPAPAPSPAPAAGAGDAAGGQQVEYLGGLDFDLSSLSLDLDAGKTAAPASAPTAGAEDMLSFDLSGIGDLATGAPVSAGGSAAAPVAAGPEDEALTQKIELADEFRQIGDDEGARALLQEVLTQGSANQRARAQAMLNELS